MEDDYDDLPDPDDMSDVSEPPSPMSLSITEPLTCSGSAIGFKATSSQYSEDTSEFLFSLLIFKEHVPYTCSTVDIIITYIHIFFHNEHNQFNFFNINRKISTASSRVSDLYNFVGLKKTLSTSRGGYNRQVDPSPFQENKIKGLRLILSDAAEVKTSGAGSSSSSKYTYPPLSDDLYLPPR